MRRYKQLPQNVVAPLVAPIPLTKSFYERLQQDQVRLQQEKAELLVRLQEAREMGDLSENGAYTYAKMGLGSVGKQLSQIGFLLEHGYVAKIEKSEHIGFGSTVLLEGASGNVTYTIVSQYEADPSKGSISLASPLGNALQGKKIGEVVSFQIGPKQTQFTVVSITY